MIKGGNMRKSILITELVLLILFLSVVPISIGYNPNIPDIKEQSFIFDNTLYVGGSGEGNYSKIQDAIDNASDGDIIFVFDGIYNETIIIDKKIKLIGENQNKTIIDGMYNEYIIRVIKDNVEIIKLTIKNSGGYKNDAGIKIFSDNTSIKECIIYRTKNGIYGENINGIEISSCIIHTNGRGVFFENSSNITIQNCQLCHNAVGILLKNSEKNTIKDSYMHNSGVVLLINNCLEIEILNCALDDNNDNQGGAFISDSKQVIFSDCNICHNGVGIRIENSSYIIIKKCNLNQNTKIAVIIDDLSDNINISNCEIKKNYNYAIKIGSKTVINNNNIYNNKLHGIYSTSKCNARYNWWGFLFGPSLTGFGIGDRITFKPLKIIYIPWSFKKIKNAGDHANLDPDNDGLNNIEECFTDQWGSDPNYKDIFLEIDWFKTNITDETNKPMDEQIEKIKKVFKRHKINIHVDTGDLGGGEEIDFTGNYTWLNKLDFYWDYFLHNDLNNPRKGVFHYGLICSYGRGGYALFGWDHMDSFDCVAQQLSENKPLFSKQHLIISVVLHELGHTLKLLGDTHGGIDNVEATRPFSRQFWLYKNYKSCMNYIYTFFILDYSDGSIRRNDFDDWGNIDLGFFKNTNYELKKGFEI